MNAALDASFTQPATFVWARGWLVTSDDGSMQLSPFPGASAGPFDLTTDEVPVPNTRYDLEGWLSGTRVSVVRMLPSMSQVEPAPAMVDGLRSWPLEDYLAGLREVESQPWFAELVVGGVGDSDKETGLPMGDCLHMKYVTREAEVWIGRQPPGRFQFWPMISDDKTRLAP